MGHPLLTGELFNRLRVQHFFTKTKTFYFSLKLTNLKRNVNLVNEIVSPSEKYKEIKENENKIEKNLIAIIESLN